MVIELRNCSPTCLNVDASVFTNTSVCGVATVWLHSFLRLLPNDCIPILSPYKYVLAMINKDNNPFYSTVSFLLFTRRIMAHNKTIHSDADTAPVPSVMS